MKQLLIDEPAEKLTSARGACLTPFFSLVRQIDGGLCLQGREAKASCNGLLPRRPFGEIAKKYLSVDGMK